MIRLSNIAVALSMAAELVSASYKSYLKGTNVEAYPYQVLEVYKRHDPNFIQGLYWDPKKKRMLESTGQYGESITQWVKLNDQDHSTKTLVKENYDPKHFGEGITPINDDTLIEMTWKEGVVKLLDTESLKEKKSFKMWPGVKEGWGITLDPEKKILYASDGSDKITRINADTLEQINQFTVKKLNGQAQNLINEMEWVNGNLWANVFYFDGMVNIDPNSGYIREAFDFAPLR